MFESSDTGTGRSILRDDHIVEKLAYYISFLGRKWSDPGPKMKIRSSLVIIILTALIFVFFRNNQIVLPPAVNLPIILTAIVFKTRGGIIAGIAAGLLLTPPVVIPVGFGLEVFNSFFQWALGSIFFIMVGIVTGSTFGILNYQFNQLKESSMFTPGSNLPNKYKLLEELEWHIKENPDSSINLIIISVENTSEIINNLGHERSGQFFRAIASQLTDKINYEGEIFNVYDDNLALLLKNNPEENQPYFIERLVRSLNEPFQFDDIPIYLETSMGMASYPEDAGSCNELFQHAYLAVNKARSKDEGLSFYNPDWDDTGKNNLLLLGGINKALKQEEFLLHFQPKIDLQSGEIIGAEALIRWQHPDMGFISPGRFIPQIERTALIDDLTYYVLDKTAESLLLLKDEGLNLHMAVNITPRNLRSDNFIEKVDEILTRTDISPNKLELELTETDVMQKMQESYDTINTLSEKGLRFALDDFGTGYSSLAYLKNLPFDCIKIDRSLVQGMTEDPRSQEIVNTAIRLGHILDKKTTAEGVEKQETLQQLQDFYCDFAQGFYIAHPMPLKELKEFCHDHN